METITASVLKLPQAPSSQTSAARPVIAVLVPCYNGKALGCSATLGASDGNLKNIDDGFDKDDRA